MGGPAAFVFEFKLCDTEFSEVEETMDISQSQAADSLTAIDATARRSHLAHVYANSSPFFIMWGVIWMIGFGVNDLWPRGSGWVWMLLTIAGFLGSIVIGRMRARAGNPHPGMTRYAGWRFLGMFVAIGLFITATYTLFRPVHPAQQAAFVPLIVALMYVLVGLWRGPRFVVTGIVVAGLTLFGYFYLPAHFMLWMAAVGGGALVLAGLWLRQV